jgi:hypothetical protein
MDERKWTPEEIRRARDTISQILEVKLPAQMGKPDWRYLDLPQMPAAEFEKFEKLVGDENLHWITKVRYPNGLKRGQLLVSPEGDRLLREAGHHFGPYGRLEKPDDV